MSKTGQFAETLIDYIDSRISTLAIGVIQGGKLVLGGGEGADGGSGIPYRGTIGQLNQRLVTYDTTEGITVTTSGVSSLVDNLNHIRAWQAPARWFEPTITMPRSMRINVASGIWRISEGNIYDYPGGTSPVITTPSVDDRLDLVYLTSSGTLNVEEGVEDTSPVIAYPTISGYIPIASVFVTPTTTVIGRQEETYSGYYKDIRPFISSAGSGGGTSLHVTTHGDEGTDPFIEIGAVEPDVTFPGKLWVDTS